MPTQLPRESFVALAAVAWADGRMSKDEALGLLSAARAHGLAGEDLASVERSTKEKVELDAFDPTALSGWQRVLTFGLASWLSRIDGVQQAAEMSSLHALARKLESTDATDHRLRAAAATAFDVSMLPEGRRPERYDFIAFESRLEERFPKLT